MDKPQNLTLRRLRLDPWVRELCQDVRLSHKQFIQPLFVVDALREREAVPGLTGVYRDTPSTLLKQIENDLERGVRKFLLFGVPAEKRADGFDYSFTAQQIAAIKKEFGQNLWLAADVCLCSYTSHGQCGLLNAEGDHLVNDVTVAALAKAGVAYAQAGANCVAPSDMMDGRIGAMRRELDAHGLHQTVIMSYAAKFHSRFYGPFRVAADSAPQGNVALKDRATYQLDPTRREEAFACAARDAQEGADILMVKPGMPYLDILADLTQRLPQQPWAVYEVSGEYAARELLGREGLMQLPGGHIEAWTSLARAGASIIISYGARHAREWLS